MPRKRRTSAVASAFHQVQQQAQSLLSNLYKEIRGKEMDLHRLKEEASRLGLLLGGRGRARVGRPPGRPSAEGRRGGRVNWRAVLQQLPKQFKAADVRKVRGVKGKRPSEIFAAITRWIESGLAKRKSRGVYEKA